ncbi:MAG: hypothetical protein KIT09_34540 [Bryobacteraceae bacterium]|nr:hypothetical protein [Bryobacteraceae bacterium]
MQGEEKLFPDNLPIEMRSSSRLGRLRDAFETPSFGGVWKANPIGTGTAAEAWGSVMPPCHN